jgi:hypothetical protein
VGSTGGTSGSGLGSTGGSASTGSVGSTYGSSTSGTTGSTASSTGTSSSSGTSGGYSAEGRSTESDGGEGFMDRARDAVGDMAERARDVLSDAAEAAGDLVERAGDALHGKVPAVTAVVGALAATVGGWWAMHAGSDTKVEVPEEDERHYRSHFETHPARATGVTYDHARTGYALGHTAARNPGYTGRRFAEGAASYDSLRDFTRYGYERGSSRGGSTGSSATGSSGTGSSGTGSGGTGSGGSGSGTV